MLLAAAFHYVQAMSLTQLQACCSQHDKEHAATQALAALHSATVLLHPHALADRSHFFWQIMAYLDLPLEAAALTDDLLDKASQPHTILPAGHRIQAPAPLIAEITAAQEAELRETYRGSQADRAQTHAAAGPSG